MKNLKIAIDLNDIVRDFYDKFHEQYCAHFGYDEEDIELSDGEIKKGFELPELKTNNLLEYYSEFNNDIDELNQFIFDEVAMEISANSDLKDFSIIGAINMFNNELKNNEQELWITSREFGKSIGGTYMFLGRNGCSVNKSLFVTKFNQMWDWFDIIITTNPEVIKCKPEGKIVVKINTTYNTEIESDLSFETINDVFGDVDNFLNEISKKVE